MNAVARMRRSTEELGKVEEYGAKRDKKKWGLVIARFAIRSPVPRSALFLK
jgi:hypothetical protein